MTETPAPAAEQRFICETGVAGQIADLVDPVIADLGFRLVRVRIMGRDEQTVQIMAERADGTISIEDCEVISRQLSPLLDAADVMPGAYNLEISSPGIDRPLVRPSDFEDWAGHRAKIELTDLLDGRRRFSGTLEGFEDGEVRLEVDLDQIGVQVIGLPVDLVGEARLVLTDELVRDSLRRSKQAEKAAQGADHAAAAGDVDGNDENAAGAAEEARDER
jgi:ribosome maturation factor RimP